jgi:hypothetical protein
MASHGNIVKYSLVGTPVLFYPFENNSKNYFIQNYKNFTNKVAEVSQGVQNSSNGSNIA